MYYFYVLRHAKNKEKFYTGYTNDLKRRFEEHEKDDNRWRLIYYEAYVSQENARTRERKIKQYGSAWRALKKRIIA